MKQIDSSRYLELLAGATVLERDGHGEKVLALADGTLVKIFRRKRWLSTALFYPYARRFVRNASRLAELQVPCVDVMDIFHCPGMARHLVVYRPLPGTTLRAALSDVATDRQTLLTSFAAFVASLHGKGIYFRSLHFGNVIVSADGGELGLIDVADLDFCPGALPVRKRLRNFRHILRYRKDSDFLCDYGWEKFLRAYLDAAALPPQAARTVMTRLRYLASAGA